MRGSLAAPRNDHRKHSGPAVFGRVDPVVYHASARDGIATIPEIDRGNDVEEEGFVREGDTGHVEEGSSHILFPVAVGTIFLVMLVAGALLG